MASAEPKAIRRPVTASAPPPVRRPRRFRERPESQPKLRLETRPRLTLPPVYEPLDAKVRAKAKRLQAWRPPRRPKGLGGIFIPMHWSPPPIASNIRASVVAARKLTRRAEREDKRLLAAKEREADANAKALSRYRAGLDAESRRRKRVGFETEATAAALAADEATHRAKTATPRRPAPAQNVEPNEGGRP